jgi:two-component system, NarL family, invasion response regulator UvrY
MIRIALADDHQQVRETWNFILSTNDNFEVVAKCCNGEEAVEAASLYLPDVFLMDINMEPMNGIEATEAINKLHPNIKIVGMSIHLEAVYVRRMLQAGASAYVTKNSSYEEVFDAIVKVHAGEKYLCHEVRKKMPDLIENPM